MRREKPSAHDRNPCKPKVDAPSARATVGWTSRSDRTVGYGFRGPLSTAPLPKICRAIFHDDDVARAHLEAQHWPNGRVCPHCEANQITKLEDKAHRTGLYQCNACRKQFFVTVGTVFEDSKIGLAK